MYFYGAIKYNFTFIFFPRTTVEKVNFKSQIKF